MIAKNQGPDCWRIDILLQRGPNGETETVFLEL